MKYLIIVLLFIAVKASGQSPFYVSSSAGIDTNDGSSTRPWKTLGKVNANLVPNATIYLKRGDTFLGSLIIKKANVTVMPYGTTGADPIISGLSHPTGWTVTGNIAKVHIPSIDSLNMLLLSGVMQNIGRYPHAGYLPFGNINKSRTSIKLLTPLPTYLTTGRVVIKNNHWIITQDSITSVTSDSIIYKRAYRNLPGFTPVNGNGFFIENNINTVDTAGAWYFDIPTKMLSVFLVNPTDTANIKIPLFNTLVSIDTTSVSSIQNISILGANSDGIAAIHTPYVTVQNCSVSYVGRNGISADPHSPSITITGCDIHHCYNNGISAALAGSVTLSSDVVHSIGLDPGRGVSDQTGLIGVVTRNNSNSTLMKIDSTGYIGIEFTGDSSSITNSFINHALLQKDDGGGIYTIPHTGATNLKQKIISRNVVMNSFGNTMGCVDGATNKLGMGIYLDINSSNISIDHNTVINSGASGLYFNFAHNNSITNNTSFNNNSYAIRFNDSSMVATNNTILNNLFCSATGSYVFDNQKNNATKLPGTSQYINSTTTGVNFAYNTSLTSDVIIPLSPLATPFSDFLGNMHTDTIKMPFLTSILYYLSGLSSNANLSNLTISSGTLTPAFAATTYEYTDIGTNATASVTVTPTSSVASAIFVNGTPVTSGAASASIPLIVGYNNIPIQVTAANGVTKIYSISVTRPSSNANLSNLTISNGSLRSNFATATTSYTDTVSNATTSITVTPTSSDTTATIKVNGTTVASGAASSGISLAEGFNPAITVQVTAGDGVTIKTYRITVLRKSSNANLSNLTISSGTLKPTFNPTTLIYTDTVTNTRTSVTVTPTVSDNAATVKVNGLTATSGHATSNISLALGTTTINTVVTSSDGSTQTYTIAVTRLPSANANLSNLTISDGTLTPTFASATQNYTDDVPNATTSVTVTPTVSEATATIKVAGITVTSGSASGSNALSVGANPSIAIQVTAGDGTTIKTYHITVTRDPPGGMDAYLPGGFDKQAVTPPLTGDGVFVHQGISANGDGVNDFLQIDGISAFPDNKLTIINHDGKLVYEVKGYDNSSRFFDGHSTNKTRGMQPRGTYFYSLIYKVKGVTKYKTGFIVLKY